MPRNRRVVWAPRARRDLLDVWRYYAQSASPEIADNILRDIQRMTAAVARNPLARRTRDDLMPGLRSALIAPHTIFFRIGDEGDIEIVRILHQRRDFPALFRRPPKPRQ